MTTPESFTPTIAVNGTALADMWLKNLVGLRVELALNLVGRTTLRFIDPGYALSSHGDVFALGAEVSIGTHTGSTAIFSGNVTGVSLDTSADSTPELTVTVDDRAAKLIRTSVNSVYSQQSYGDILSKVAASSGLTADTTSGPVEPFVLQAGSDLAFLNTVCERTGFAWWVDDRTLHVKPVGSASPSQTLEVGKDLLSFSVRASAHRPSTVALAGWDVTNQDDVKASVNSSSSRPDPSSFAAPYTGSNANLGTFTLNPTAVSPMTPTEASTMAQAMYDEWLAGAVVARGASATMLPKLKPATVVKVTNAGPTSADYLLTRVEHIYSGRGFTTRFTAGSNRPTSLVDTLRPPTGDGGFSFQGLTTGIVTDIDDPDKVYRVKVQYTGRQPATVSGWARTLSMGAGKERGFIFHPEVGDEVLVGFDHGDTRRPVVLGGLFSSKNNALATWPVKDGQVSTRRITSRLGHVIEFADGAEPATQHILLQLKNSHKLRLGSDKFEIELAAGKPVSIKSGDATFEMTDAGDIKLSANNITINAKAKVTIKGEAGVDIDGGPKTSVAGVSVEVKGDGQTEVSSSGQLALKGAVVMIN